MTITLSPQHRSHLAGLRESPATIDAEGLRIGSQYTMFFAEAELMARHVDVLTSDTVRPDVLEIGMGLGVFAEQLATRPVASYTAVEPHDGIVRLTGPRIRSCFGDRATVLTSPWQTLDLPANGFDAIMYDTWPPDGLANADFAQFVEQVAIRCLRPGGRFSFFNSGSRLDPHRQRILGERFAAWQAHPYTLPLEQRPQHWTKPTVEFLVPVARKGVA